MDKVAIYCRLSDEDKDKKSSDDDSESIQNQKKLLTNYAEEKGWEIYNIYSDDDYSGLDFDRPEFNHMLKDAQDKKFNIILCKTQSRFTRDMELVEKYLHKKFIEWGIRFVTAVDGVDTSDKHNKKSRQINGLINQWYCEDTSESIKAIFKLKQREGKFIGSFASYGYTKDPNNKNKLLIDREAADIVRLIFNLYLSGSGTQRIANILNEKDVSNPTKYKKLKGLKYKNSSAHDEYGLWNKTAVKRILKNELYIGNMVQNKRCKEDVKSKKVKALNPENWIIVEGTHEAIIDKEIFNNVKKRLNSNVRSCSMGQTHIFSGKIQCKDCKSLMTKSSNGSGYSYLRCRLYTAAPKKGLCKSHSIQFEVLKTVVEERAKENINMLCNSKRLCSELIKENSTLNKIKKLETDANRIHKEIIKREEAIKNLYLDKVSRSITEEQFIEFNKAFSEERNKLKAQYEDIGAELNNLEVNNNVDEQTAILVEKYKNFSELSHIMVNELIDYIEVGEVNPTAKEQEIIIHWNF